MSRWSPKDVEAHIDFERRLKPSVALVEAQVLTGPELAKIGSGCRS